MPVYLANLTDVSLFLLRLMVGLVFLSSGYNDVRRPDDRAKGLGLSRGFVLFLACAELAGGLGVIIGVLVQLASAGLILIMLGAVQKKIFVWKTGFWGEDGLGWNYECILISMLFVTLCTGGGQYVILH